MVVCFVFTVRLCWMCVSSSRLVCVSDGLNVPCRVSADWPATPPSTSPLPHCIASHDARKRRKRATDGPFVPNGSFLTLAISVWTLLLLVCWFVLVFLNYYFFYKILHTANMKWLASVRAVLAGSSSSAPVTLAASPNLPSKADLRAKQVSC